MRSGKLQLHIAYVALLNLTVDASIALTSSLAKRLLLSLANFTIPQMNASSNILGSRRRTHPIGGLFDLADLGSHVRRAIAYHHAAGCDADAGPPTTGRASG